MAINVAKLKGYMNAEMNILIAGPAGTGKTQMLKAAADSLGWNMKYYSTSTLDPFVHLIGLPVPDNENQKMDFYRDDSVDNADVIFFDEANRASDQTINAIFEIVQFRSLNGTPLPKLKSVVIAINPVTDGYEGNDELDLAFIDRFHVYLESTPVADPAYFKKKFGREFAGVGISLFNEYQTSYKAALRNKTNSNNMLGYLSPRRLEIIMDNYLKFPSAETISISVPSDVTLGAKRWDAQFSQALSTPASTVGAAPSPAKAGGTEADVTYQLKLPAGSLRASDNVEKFKRAYTFAVAQDAQDGKTRQDSLLKALAVALSYGVGPKAFQTRWRDVVQDFTPQHRQTMMNNWPYTKQTAVEAIFGW